MRSYTVHWRRFSIALPMAFVMLYRVHREGGPTWFVANLLMVLVLLLSIRRDHQGFDDEWPEQDGDYLRFYSGPLAGRPVRVRGELVAREIVDSAAMLLPEIADPNGTYVLNRRLKRYDWTARSAAKSISPND